VPLGTVKEEQLCLKAPIGVFISRPPEGMGWRLGEKSCGVGKMGVGAGPGNLKPRKLKPTVVRCFLRKKGGGGGEINSLRTDQMLSTTEKNGAVKISVE